MTIASRNCQDRVQRLRGWGKKAPLPSGSQLPYPRTLRPGRPSGLNMPHPTRPGVQGYAQVLAAPAMGQRAAVKRWHTAQIAASKRWKCLNAEPLFLFRHPSEGWGPACLSAKEGGGMPAMIAGMTELGEVGEAGNTSISRASAQHHTTPPPTPARADATAGTVLSAARARLVFHPKRGSRPVAVSYFFTHSRGPPCPS